LFLDFGNTIITVHASYSKDTSSIMREILSTRLLLSSLILLFTTITTATEPPSGPTATISIKSSEPFQTMKPCARKCLVYEGIYDFCGFDAPYYDLGIAISCGCYPQNFCYCDKNAAASATSYISACVGGGCGTDLPGEVTSVLSLYNAYCSTANVKVEAATTPENTSPTSNPTAIAGPTNSVTTTGSVLAAEKSESVSNTSNTVKKTQAADTTAEKKGLSSSDVIALGVGLGVGVPSLLLGLATFCMARRNKRQRSAAVQVHPRPVTRPEISYVR
jgi:hypothetical protein